ncbi:WAS/WASL-interacting protein family member 3-like [Macrobrachium rosenbergii]|uniref:WAS/WASL-interacting protein family member 3-like n=1 Tax=Macrobrachium rosenbergii TaxID=79674 RepID=UPI0034D79D92
MACKVYGHSPSWAKCPRNNKSSTPAVALAVTNPESLGPPAEGPIYVAPPRGSYPACQVKAFDDSGTQISLIRKDKVPYGAIINRRKLVTIEGDSKVDSKSLPVPLACTEPCQAPSVTNDEQIPKQIMVPAPALVPPPEHAPDLHSRDPNKDPLSSPGLAPLPVPVGETDPADHSGSSPKGAASQPVPEPVIPTWEPLTPSPLPTASSLSQSSADTAVSKDSAMFQMANELKELRQIVIELARKVPAPAVKEADTGGTPVPSPGSVPPIPRPRQTIKNLPLPLADGIKGQMEKGPLSETRGTTWRRDMMNTLTTMPLAERRP